LKNFLINKPEIKNWRLDKWLKINFSSLNQSFIEKNLRKGNIKVNNKKKLSKYKLQINDEVIIFNYSDETYKNIIKQFSKKIIPTHYNDLFKSAIIYENDDFIIINKWSGIATQGGSKINISIDHIIKNISEKYNLVHRLDRETSGLLIIAKNLQTTKIFGKLFKDHLIFKLYLAVCEGSPKNNESEINLSIADKKDPSKSSNSVTRYKVFQTKNSLSNIIFSPKTGKTHQLRIVAKHLGCPIVGDTKYNKQHKYNFEKLKLNAHVLRFTINENNYEFVADLPDDFKIFLKKNSFKIINKEDLKIFL
jgi:23S rRNA pseudouridine955/2504/2580 synthase